MLSLMRMLNCPRSSLTNTYASVDTCMRVCALALVLVLGTSEGKQKANMKIGIGVVHTYSHVYSNGLFDD